MKAEVYLRKKQEGEQGQRIKTCSRNIQYKKITKQLNKHATKLNKCHVYHII